MERRSGWFAAVLAVLFVTPARAEEGGAWSVVPFALPAYQPETSWMVGGAAALVFQPPKERGGRESQVLLAGAASIRKQFSLLLQSDIYLVEDRLNLAATLSTARFPDLFFGVGAETRHEDAEPYTPILHELELSPKWRIAPGLYLGPTARVHYVQIDGVAPGGVLERGGVTGARGGVTAQLGVAALWDTRDSTLYPREGHLVRANLRTAQPGFGSSFRFELLELDGRRYMTLPWNERHVLAVQGQLELRRGDPPFYELGRLGGMEIGRGYYEGRYRGRQHLAAQVEYRAPLFWRLGGVAFASASTVMPALTEAGPFRVRPAGGLGLRFAPLADVPVNVRLDVAYGDDLAFYLNVGEAF